MSYPNSGNPVDWTNGTGVFPGNTVTIPANNKRKWLRVQNQDAGTVTVGIAAVSGADGTTAVVANMILASGGASGSQGAADDLSFSIYVPLGQITVTGTAGQKVLILEG